MNDINCLGIIPARYESMRLHAKALEDIGGKTLIQRVWEQASKAKYLSRVIVATDDERIYQAAKQAGAEAVMTSAEHRSGTDRTAEALDILENKQGVKYDLVANVQGDMPFIHPAVIDQAIEGLTSASEGFGISTIAIPIYNANEFERESTVKVVAASDGRALCFSRSPIPFHRKTAINSETAGGILGFKHLGLYIFRREILKQFTALAPCDLEKQEHLEQLRALYNNIKIKVVLVDTNLMSKSIEIDTPQDLARARKCCE